MRHMLMSLDGLLRRSDTAECFLQGFLEQFLSLTDNATSPENNITAVIYQMSGDLAKRRPARDLLIVPFL